jgi:hypothetical protein
MSFPDIATIRQANAKVNDNGYLLLTATRPFGPYLAWLWMWIGLTPRQVNYLSIVFAIVIVVMATRGGSSSPPSRFTRLPNGENAHCTL